MNLERKIVALLASAIMMLTITGSAAAYPAVEANCTGERAQFFKDISYWARHYDPVTAHHVSVAARSDCTSLE